MLKNDEKAQMIAKERLYMHQGDKKVSVSGTSVFSNSSNASLVDSMVQASNTSSLQTIITEAYTETNDKRDKNLQLTKKLEKLQAQLDKTNLSMETDLSSNKDKDTKEVQDRVRVRHVNFAGSLFNGNPPEGDCSEGTQQMKQSMGVLPLLPKYC